MTTKKPADTASEIEAEVQAEDTTTAAPRTFTAIINGEERELVDRTGGKIPAEAMFLGNQRLANKYAPALLEKILGEDGLMDIFEMGATLDELSEVAKAWVRSVNAGN